LIGAAAWSSSQEIGNETEGDGTAEAWVSGGAEGVVGLDGVEGEGGRVTEVALSGLVTQRARRWCGCPAARRVRIAVLKVCARGRQLSCCAHEVCRCAGSGAPVADVAILR
jgi:hypothetical protein